MSYRPPLQEGKLYKIPRPILLKASQPQRTPSSGSLSGIYKTMPLTRAQIYYDFLQAGDIVMCCGRQGQGGWWLFLLPSGKVQVFSKKTCEELKKEGPVLL